jgi:hypothetical protein
MVNKRFALTAKITEIGELIQIRRTVKPDMYKRVLTLETEDSQILYPEIRNTGLKILEREGIVIGDTVDIEYTFQGAEKNEKKYNNILIQSIKRI